MKWLMAIAAVLCAMGAAPASAEPPEPRTVRLQWTPGLGSGPVEGRLTVAPGKVLRLQGWKLFDGDAIGTDWSWRCARGEAGARVLLATLSAPREASLQVTVGTRTFAFTLSDLAKGVPLASPNSEVVAETLPTPRPLSLAGECDFPALAWSPRTGLWAAWIAFDGREDRIGLSRLAEGQWQPRGTLPRARGTVPQIALAAAGDRLVAVWVEQRDGNWELFGASGNGERWDRPVRITRSEGPDMAPQLAADASGHVWLAWQAFEGSFAHIRVACWESGRWAPSMLVTERPANHWAPAISAGPKGEVHIAWDSCQAGSYDIYVRSLAGGRLSPVRRITDGPEYEANASVACDAGGRVWIAYDQGEADWGSDRRAADLHRERRVGLRCLAGEQLVQPPLPCGKPEGVAPYAEAPRLGADVRGQVWIAYRRTLREGTWDLVAQRFDGRAWSSPILLPDSAGRSDMRAAFAPGAEGSPWVAWATDDRDAPLIHHAVWAAELPQGFPDPDGIEMPRVGETPAGTTTAWAPRRRPGATYSRDGFTLYQGDLQRYTELSGCHTEQHGSMLDGIRFALDAAQLDFVAFAMPRCGTSPGERFRWHVQQAVADLYTVPGTLVSFRRFECRAPNGGAAALFRADEPLPGAGDTPSPDTLWQSLLSGTRPVGILGALCGWNTPQAPPDAAGRADLVAPIEGLSSSATPDAAQVAGTWWLSPAARTAVVAGTGHQDPTRRTYLWSGYLTRDAVVQGLRQRRTYIGPAGVTVHFSAEGKPIGSVVYSGGKPVILVARVAAGTPIRQVQILMDGQVVETKDAGGETEAEAAVTHDGKSAADHAFAVRVICADGGECWTTPIWVSDPKV